MNIEPLNHLGDIDFLGNIHKDLIAAQDLIYNLIAFKCSEMRMETEGSDYGAYVFKLNNLSIRFRVAKITPTKVGQFVTLWQRDTTGKIQPYDVSDMIDFFVVSTRQGDFFGQFVFPKAVLLENKVLSRDGLGGKLAIRVYPPWDKTTSKQALKTQTWQSKYFLEVPKNKPLDLSRCLELYSLKT